MPRYVICGLPLAFRFTHAGGPESQIAWLRKTLAVGSCHLATTRGACLRLALDDKAVIFLAMASLRVATSLAGYFHAASLAELEENQIMIVHGADRPVLTRMLGRPPAQSDLAIPVTGWPTDSTRLQISPPPEPKVEIRILNFQIVQ